MLKDIEKAVREHAKSGAERLRLEIKKHRRFSGGYVSETAIAFEFNVVDTQIAKSCLLKSGKLSASIINQMKNISIDGFKLITMN